jgi:hypothetical protein
VSQNTPGRAVTQKTIRFSFQFSKMCARPLAAWPDPDWSGPPFLV